MPFFSIIITTYHRPHLVTTAIESVLGQKFQNFELIIVNDASTDNTLDVLSSYKDERIKVISNEKNLHKGGARNVGIDNSRGKYICFLDDDDYYLSNHLEVLHNEITKDNELKKGLFFTLSINKNIITNKESRRVMKPIGNENRVNYVFHHQNGIPTSLVCVNKDILSNEKFNPHIRIGQDTELFMRVVANHPIFPIQEYTVVQIYHGGNSGGHKYNNGLDRLKGYKYIFENPDVSQQISKKTKNIMYAYCYLRMSEYYAYHKDRKNTLKSACKALYHYPFDKNIKIKLTFIAYNLPIIGKIIKYLNRI